MVWTRCVCAAGSSGRVPEGILIGTGSEVQLAVAAREILEAAGVATRVESMPSQEWFVEQTAAYRERVLTAACGHECLSTFAGFRERILLCCGQTTQTRLVFKTPLSTAATKATEKYAADMLPVCPRHTRLWSFQRRPLRGWPTSG